MCTNLCCYVKDNVQETESGEVEISKVRDDGDLGQLVSSRDSKEWWDSGCILEI